MAKRSLKQPQPQMSIYISETYTEICASERAVPRFASCKYETRKSAALKPTKSQVTFFSVWSAHLARRRRGWGGEYAERVACHRRGRQGLSEPVTGSAQT